MCKEPEIDPKDPFGENQMLSVNTNSNVVDIFYNGEWRYTGVLIATMSPEGCFDGESPYWLVLSRTGETVMVPYGDEQWNLVYRQILSNSTVPVLPSVQILYLMPC